jgi:hypothetical protein
MPAHELHEEVHNDDRMYVLHLAKCTISYREDGMKATTVHHSGSPPDSLWCVVTYRNTSSFPPTRVDPFQSEREARAFLERIEPTTPRVSLSGQAPRAPLPHSEWLAWKAAAGVEEFDHRKLYPSHAENAAETLYSLP